MSREPSGNVISKTAAILRAFTRWEPDMTLAQVSERVGLPKPTTHRLLFSLAHEGFIYQDPLTRRYSLGLGLVQVASTVLHRGDLSDRATTHLRELQSLCAESVSLQLRVGHERLCVCELESVHTLRMAATVGRVRPLCTGAAGKAILAFLSEPEQDATITTYLAALPPDRRNNEEFAMALKRTLAQVRSQGYAISHGENTPGATAIAAPIFDAGCIVGAVNISGPESRWTLDAMRPIIEPLRHTARIVSTLAELPLLASVPA